MIRRWHNSLALFIALCSTNDVAARKFFKNFFSVCRVFFSCTSGDIKSHHFQVENVAGMKRKISEVRLLYIYVKTFSSKIKSLAGMYLAINA